ncbi:alpha/beta hydrolase [Ornithinimicrobium sp. F0845]|uniref:alpha/beta hydrolase n=1 Tax=Ornithinimicrobium sp. F0845 TaxID=2926412 RepID=UPI001FF3D1FD|nr:alpha/beta hydrolase [Ornithinimicrobium sp. F0845]MCK0111604.1 alpha/beta hydrolase [Ornithinimicrobium sp. F0845]
MAAEDPRYEPYVRPLPRPVRRVRSTWRWRDRDGRGEWLLNVEHVGDDDARVRMILVHGAGGNAAAMWPFAAHLSLLGTLVTVLDLPGYGRSSQVAGPRGCVRYPHWQQVLEDLVKREHDDRPLVLVGASMGGMLALDAALSTGLADRVVVTCLLDVSRPEVRAEIVRWPWLATVGLPLLRLAQGPLANVLLPIRWLTPMATISNSPALSAEVLRDRHGGRGAMPLGWYRTFLDSRPALSPMATDHATAIGRATGPGRVAQPPVILLHPGEDRWTAPEFSESFLARLAGPTRSVRLEGCGHFPVEEPGFQQLLDEVAAEVSSIRRDA